MAIRVTTTGQTTFVKKVVIGTPVRSVTGTGASFTTLNDVTITNASQKQIITFDSAQQKFINTDSATLVNLTVSGNILPAADSASDLGSATKKFKDLFLSGSTITLGTLRLKDSGGGLAVADSAGQEKPLSLEGSKSQIRSFFSSGGDISYDSSKGQFSIDVETVYTKANFDSDLGAALSGGTGITYDSSSDTISLTNTSVTAATYGSTTQVPQIAVNAQGQITGASNVAIAHDNLSGFVANEHIDHTSVSIATGTGLSGGGTIASTRTLKIDSSDLASLYSKVIAHDNTSGFVADEHVAHSNVSVVAGKGLSGGGTIASSRTIDIDSANVRGMLSGGTGITYNSSTGAISTTDTDINHDNLSGFVANEHIDHSTVSVTAGKGLSGGGTIASTRTIDIDSANVRGMFSGSNGISYSTSTGDIRAPQPLDSAANPTFNQLRGPATFVIDPAAIGDSTGTVKIMGNLQVEGTQTTINSSTIVLKDKNIVIADSAVDSSALNGAGFTWGDSAIVNNPTFNYSHSNARLEANRPISATSFVGNLTGNASGTAATVTNAAQTNITSLGTLTGLTVNGDVAFDSAGGILFDVSDKALEIGAGYKISGLKTTDSAIIGGDGSTGGVTISDGLVDIRSNTGNVSKVKFYCEVSNAHFQTLQAAPHAAGSSAVIVLPTASGTLLNEDGSGASLTSLNASQLSSGTVPSARLSLSASDIPNLAASKITSGTISSDRLSLSASDIPNLAASKITSGTFDSARIPVLAINASNITGGTIASARLSLSASDIPNLAASKITSGTISNDRISLTVGDIPNLAASKITSGTFDSARIPAIQINANRITTGTIDSARLPAGTFGGGGGGGGIDSAAVLTVAGTGIFNTTGEAATATTAGTATNVTVADESTDTTCFPLFVTAATGNLPPKSGSNLSFNSSSGLLTATAFSGSAASLSQIPMGEASGTLAAANVGNLPASKITSGSFANDISFDSAGGILFDISDKALEFGDNYKAKFGNGSDLEIYHSGSNSFIRDVGTGSLYIDGTNIFIRQNTNELGLAIRQNSSVDLHYDAAKKLETTAYGATVTGTINADSATVTQNIRADGGNLIMGDEAFSSSTAYVGMKTSNQSGTGDYMIISGTSDGNTYVSAKSGSSLLLRGGGNSSTHQIRITSSLATADGDFAFDSGGAIQFDKSDQALEFGDNYKAKFGAGGDFKVFHGGTNTFLNNETGDLLITNKANDADVEIKTDDGSGGTATYFLADGSTGAAELYHYGSKKLATASGGVSITGTATATTFSGSGASLTSIPAGQLTGDIDAARITNVAASAITSGTIDSARMPAGTFGGGGGGTADAIAADNIQVGDAAINLTTSAGNITIDAQGNDTDIIFKGTDGGNDRTFLTIDGSEAGKATFLSEIVSTGLEASGDVSIDSAGGFLFDVSDKALEFGDNYKASFGAGSDLQIFHDGTNSRIYGTTGDTLIGQNTFGAVKLTSNNDAENMLVATVNGAVELYYDNSKKFETTSAGATVTGTLAATLSTAAQANITSLGTLTGLTSTGDVTIDSAGGFLFDVSDHALEFGDNYKASFGASGDLIIRHSGSHSVISDVGTGDLLISGSTVRLMSSNISENMIRAVTDGAVELYYDNSKKLETTSSGVTVTGQLATGQAVLRDWSSSDTDIDALMGGSNFGNIIEGRLNAHLVLGIRNNDTTDGVTIISSDSDFNTHSVYTNHVVSFKADGDIEIDSAGALMYDKSDKALEFGDNYKATFGAGADLAIFHDGSNSAIIDQGTGGLFIRGSSINIDDTSSNDYITATEGGAVTLFHNGSSKLATASGGVSITGTATATTFSGSGASLTNIPMGQATGTLGAARVGELPASKITSGTFDSARIPVMAINASNITAGTIADARLPASISSDITGNAATATALETARNIGGVSFDGTANINLPGVNTSGNQNTSGTAAIATSITATANNSTNETVYLTFVDGATGTQGIETDTGLTYNPSTGNITATKFTGDGSALTGISAGVSDGIFLEYQKRVTSNYNVDAGVTALTACNDSDGIEIISGVTVTISDSSGWVITGGDKNMGLDAMIGASNQTERTMRTGTIKPTLNNTYDLGDSAVAWRNIYTNDLNLSNETGPGNDVDGTTGKWTIQEGEENLYIINRKTGKKYKFMLEEIV